MKRVSSFLLLMFLSVICFSQAYKSDDEQKMIDRFNKYNNEKLLDVNLMEIDGTAKTLSDFDNKLKLLDFWATWCRACVNDIPAQEEVYQRLKNRYGQHFEWINISVDKDTSAWKRLIESKGKAGINLIGHIDSIKNSYHVNAYPTYVLINENNEVIGYDIATLDWGGSQFLEYLILKGMEGMASGEVWDSIMISSPGNDNSHASKEFMEWRESYYEAER